MCSLSRLLVALAGAPSLVALLASDAAAQAPPTSRHKVTVYSEGSRASESTDLLKSALPETADVASSDDFKKALAKQGQKLPLGLTITLDSKRKPMVTKIGKALAELGAEAGLIGFVRPKRAGGQEVLVLVIEPNKEEPSIEKAVTLGQGSTKADIDAVLKDLVDAWKPAPTTEPVKPEGGGDKPEEKKEDTSVDEGEWVRPKNVYGHEIFGINASFDIGGRFFSYNDAITSNLRDYDVFGQPGVSARVEVFPLAPLGIVVLRDIGLTGEFRMAPGLSSQTKDGRTVDTQWLRFGGGLRYRVPLGDKEKPFVLAARGGFVRDGFTLTSDDATLQQEVPSVEYNLIKGGLDGRFPIGPIAITAFGDYLGAIAAGEVYDRFTEPSIGGIDVGLGLTVPIVYGLELRLQGEYVRWFYAFAPVVGDAYVAGGALDQNIHIELGPQYVF